MSSELDRFFDLLQGQSEELKTQGKLLATIQQSQADTHERLFGSGQAPGAIPYLHGEVSKHGRQIIFWKGAIAVLTVLWTGAVALAAAIIKHR